MAQPQPEALQGTMIDLILERRLNDLLQFLRASRADDLWQNIQKTAQEIADNLRTRNSVDHHTLLGKTDLPKTLTSLLVLSLEGSHLPTDARAVVVNEILRVGANLCMDHNDNRAALLEVGFPQAVIALLEAYAETIPSPPDTWTLPLSTPHLTIIRTSVGVLLNASLNFDPIKARLNSLEAASTIIKLSSAIYSPTVWTFHQTEPDFTEEWSIRSRISNWAWRTVSTLKDIQDDSLHVINAEVISWIVPSLLNFCPPQPPEASHLAEADPDLLEILVHTDYAVLEETCTLIESYSLDVEDFRLELARSVCHPKKDQPIQCLHGILRFIEEGSYPPIWSNSIFEESERKTKEKGFDNCKAALIKAFVEVFGEAKNEDVIWKSDDMTQPGGALVAKMVQWIKDHVSIAESSEASGTAIRDDMTICASLSLGNLARKPNIAASLLSPPYALAHVLASLEFLSPPIDLKLKHGILGLLKHMAQFSKVSPVVPQTLSEAKIISRISASGIWDKKTDAMANIIQLNAIGVAKHLCNGNLDHTFALVLPSEGNELTGLSQILALSRRSYSVPVTCEGSRVVVNVVRSLWLLDRDRQLSDDVQKKREKAISAVLTSECISILTSLIGRSNRYPILVNEGLVAITLLSTHKQGAPLVLDALFTPVNTVPTVDATSTNGDISVSSSIPLSAKDGLPVPRHALDMLIYALKNIDNPVNFPIEVRVNVCTFFLQLQKNVAAESLSRVKEAVLPVARKVLEYSQDEPKDAKLFKATSVLVQAWTTP